VTGGGRAIQAQRDRFDAAALQGRDCLRGQKGRARSHRDAEAPRPRATDEREHIRALERIPAGQDHVRRGRAGGGDLIEKPKTFDGGEFLGVSRVCGGGSAMPANQIAGARHFPVHTPGCPVEDEFGIHLPASA